MNLPNICELIFNDSKLKRKLGKLADFYLIKPITEVKKINIKSSATLIVIAQDGSGGYFAIWDEGVGIENSPIIYVGSEGRSGKIANTFDDLLSLFLAYLTNWRSFYLTEKENENKELKEDIEGFVQEQMEYDPELDSIREELMETLSISPMIDPFGYLQNIARSKSPQIYTLNGDVYHNVFQK